MSARRLILFLVALCTVSVGATDPAVGALVDAGRWRKAQPLLEAAVKANPNDADALYQLSRVKVVRGETDAALPLAEKAAALQPKNATYRFQVASVVARQAQQASVFRQIGLARKFRREGDAALALDPNHLDALEFMMQFYLQAPSIAGGDRTKARSVAARIRSVNAADGFLADAALAADAKQTAQLGSLYRSAVSADPAHAKARRTLANYLIQPDTRNWPEAEVHARELVRLAPDRADSYALLAAALAGQKKLAEIDAVLAAAAATVPESQVPAYRAANALLAVEADLPRAERYFRQYLAQQFELGTPSHAAAQWRLALVLEKQGRKADAVAALRQAVSADPKLEGARADLRRLQ
jgi:hypothetical protein